MIKTHFKPSLIIFLLLVSINLQANEAEKTITEKDITTGEAIYNGLCADVCHQAPRAGRLKPKQWQVVLRTMQVHMKSSGMTPLTDTEFNQVLSYLTQSK